ncbi:MAG: hypothetical protein WC623_17355 [Pedobacter sp.]|uniref:hypothetical protein n=1 Tax=Pedobacter sp. TaxID=1411316 RepID=UPI0035696110
MMNIKRLALFTALVMALSACNKDELSTRAVSVQVRGYNIGNSELEIAIDTVVYDKFKTGPNTLLNFGKVYTYSSSKEQALLKIKDATTGKEVYQSQLELNAGGLEQFFPFVYINGATLEIKAPAADPSTNKMAFYIYYPQSNDPMDIYMKNKNGDIVYIAKNVVPGTWGYSDYVTTTGFTSAEDNYDWFFVKAGTTNQWAFNDSEWMSQFSTGTLFIPKKSEKGRVQTYFVTPASNQLDVVSLFKGIN